MKKRKIYGMGNKGREQSLFAPSAAQIQLHEAAETGQKLVFRHKPIYGTLARIKHWLTIARLLGWKEGE